MQVIHDQSGLGATRGGVLIPTMGALHEGHAALIRHGALLARELGTPCVVSIFVNPTQFNQPSDFARYPRTLTADLQLCQDAGATAVFTPDREVVYPPDAPVAVPPLPSAATEPGLEDRFRPGHFAGVCQVVMRLFRLLEPLATVFGEKDWQQLKVVEAMTREAGLPVRIVPHPILRDPDGLAMSSRNRFLSHQERDASLAIPRALAGAATIREPAAAEALMRDILATAGLKAEYAAAREAAGLGTYTGSTPGRVLIAAWSGGTRLIDNAPWPAAIA